MVKEADKVFKNKNILNSSLSSSQTNTAIEKKINKNFLENPCCCFDLNCSYRRVEY